MLCIAYEFRVERLQHFRRSSHNLLGYRHHHIFNEKEELIKGVEGHLSFNVSILGKMTTSAALLSTIR